MYVNGKVVYITGGLFFIAILIVTTLWFVVGTR